MHEDSLGNCSDEQCVTEFARLFPPEFWRVTGMRELAPQGWERSPLRLAFHPTVEQVFQEALQFHRNLALLSRSREPARPEPTFADIEAEYRESKIDAERELRELLGRSLWDVFSDNHDVRTPDGRILDIGSFRGAGGFIADYLNDMLGETRYDYMDFYLGTIWLSGRTDLTPVYALIFHQLRRHGFDWVYCFPRLHLVDFRPLREMMAASSEPEWLNYSPEASWAQQRAEETRDGELAELQESLDAAHRQDVEEARRNPPPPTVSAYRAVYGQDPGGWPPAVD